MVTPVASSRVRHRAPGALPYRESVPAYLSDEWLLAMDDVMKHHAGLAIATADTSIVIQNVITGTPTGTVSYHIRLDHGSSQVTAGVDPEADVTFTTDQATAGAINGGHESAQTAFMAGRLRIGGDTRVLIANQGALMQLDDLFAQIRADGPDGSRDA